MFKYLALSLILSFCARGQMPMLEIFDKDLVFLNGERKEGLFDEAELFKNQTQLSKPSRFFSASYNEIYLPQEILIPLNGLYQVDSLVFYDGAGKDSVSVFIGNPKNWQLGLQTSTNLYNQWRSFKLSQQGEFILLKINSSQAQIGEMRFYGQLLQNRKAKYKLKASPQARRTFSEIFGINAFNDDPLEIVKPVASSIREYHNWDWDEGNGAIDYQATAKAFAWNPSYVSNWNFDAYYAKAKQLGLKVYPCLQGSAFPYRGNEDFNVKPLKEPYKAKDPRRYTDHSQYVFQMAARYGSRELDANRLLLKADNKSLSGLNLIAGIEVWNEPDKWWKGREGYFHPFEFAALLSADYDGHEGMLGKNAGIKNADPNLPLIMGGLAETNLDYLLGMKYWSQYNRRANFPAEVLNFHHYSNNAGGQNGNASRAASPERDSLRKRIERLVDFRDRHFPDKELWLSEFGYDSNPNSPQGVKPLGAYSAEEMQAIWLVRTYLAISASGLDRAHLYMLRDVNAANPNKYNSSGLRREKWSKHAPKPAYQAIASILDLLGDYYFIKQVQQQDESVYIYEFQSRLDGARIWALWLGTESAKQLFNFPLGRANNYEIVQFKSDFTLEIKRGEKTEDLKVSLSEKPFFIRWKD